MIIHVPDTHVGRCTNLRQRFDSNGYPYFVRCVDYAATPHVCSFEPEPEPSPDSWVASAIYSPPKPTKWVKP